MMIVLGDRFVVFYLFYFEIILDYIVNLLWLCFIAFGDEFFSTIVFKNYKQFNNAVSILLKWISQYI